MNRLKLLDHLDGKGCNGALCNTWLFRRFGQLCYLVQVSSIVWCQSWVIIFFTTRLNLQMWFSFKWCNMKGTRCDSTTPFADEVSSSTCGFALRPPWFILKCPLLLARFCKGVAIVTVRTRLWTQIMFGKTLKGFFICLEGFFSSQFSCENKNLVECQPCWKIARTQRIKCHNDCCFAVISR